MFNALCMPTVQAMDDHELSELKGFIDQVFASEFKRRGIVVALPTEGAKAPGESV
jgi:hypothetical protein